MNPRNFVVMLCAAAAPTLAAAATDDLVININGAANQISSSGYWAPLEVSLDAGTYLVTPVRSTYPGALYTAFSYGWPGYSAAYAIGFASDDFRFYGNTAAVASEELAFAGSAKTSFTLDSHRIVYFGVGDSYYWDNSGGVSLHLQRTAPVPEPASYAMLLAGLGLIGGIARRRSPSR